MHIRIQPIMGRSTQKPLPHVRIVQELLERDGTQAGLAKRLGVSQPTITRWIQGAEPKGRHQRRIMEEAREVGIINHPDEMVTKTVPVVGYVKAGGEAHIYEEGQGPFGEAAMPPGGDGALIVAVVVKGDSMAGVAEDGWLIYYDTRRDPPTEDLYGKLCVVGGEDGRILLKRLYPGSKPGLFTLLSSSGAPIHDVKVAWAARVSWIAPQ